jgi:hypothetical protein
MWVLEEMMQGMQRTVLANAPSNCHYEHMQKVYHRLVLLSLICHEVCHVITAQLHDIVLGNHTSDVTF